MFEKSLPEAILGGLRFSRYCSIDSTLSKRAIPSIPGVSLHTQLLPSISFLPKEAQNNPSASINRPTLRRASKDILSCSFTSSLVTSRLFSPKLKYLSTQNCSTWTKSERSSFEPSQK